MKKVFKVFVVLIFVFIIGFYVKPVFSNSGIVCQPDGGCSCPKEDPYYDSGILGNEPCIGEFQISQQEIVNMINIKKIILNFDKIENQIIPSLIYLSDDITGTLTRKLNSYYEDNHNSISTSTIESLERSSRDLFFADKYNACFGFSDSVHIFTKYNDLGYSIQNLITLLNTTKLYIKNSDLDMSQFVGDIELAEQKLQKYINAVNADINNLSRYIADFNVDDSNSFVHFLTNFDSINDDFNVKKNEYLSVRDTIRDLAISAIQKVEAAYNKNSSITASPNQIYNDGSISTVTVTIKDSLNNPIQNKLVTLRAEKSTALSPANQITNEKGEAEFSVSSQNVGYISLEAIIEGVDFTISGSYLIEVITSPSMKGCQDSGGEWNFILQTCTCPVDTEWDNNRLICIGLPQIGCESSGGKWTGQECICADGFFWDEKELKCLGPEIVIDEKICVNGGGKWIDGKCICPDGFVWDERELACVKKE